VKKLLILILFLVLTASFSCNKNSGDVANPTNTENLDLSANSRSSDSLIYTSTDDGYLFFNETDSMFHFVQTDSTFSLSTHPTYSSHSTGSLTLVINGVNFTMSNSSNTYGVGWMKGPSYMDHYLTTDAGGDWIFDTYEDAEMTCRCRLTILSFADCDGGGYGSTGCSLGSGSDSCSTSCDGVNAFACCKN